MQLKLPKTFTQVVQVQPAIAKATKEEMDTVSAKYPVPCDFAGAGCDARFKTKAAMLIHRQHCTYNYATTEEAFSVDHIVSVFGHKTRRLFKVVWEGHRGEYSWVPEHLLLRDGCKESIDEYWAKSGNNLALDFHPDTNGAARCWMCGWTSNSTRKKQALDMHIRRKRHKWAPKRTRRCEQADVKRAKLESRQHSLEHVYWGDLRVNNC